MRFSPLGSSDDFMGRGGLRFSLSLIVSELWRHNDVISRFAKVFLDRDADCTPGREPRSVAASLYIKRGKVSMHTFVRHAGRGQLSSKWRYNENDVIMIIAGSWRRGHGLHRSGIIENQSGLLGHDVVDTLPTETICEFLSVFLQGGPAKLRPIYIFDGNIWMHG